MEYTIILIFVILLKGEKYYGIYHYIDICNLIKGEKYYAI